VAKTRNDASDGRVAEAEPEPGPQERPAGRTTAHVCNVAFCPISLALSAVEPMKPDVVEHLLVAGREFFLAAKAVLDARAEDFAKDRVSPTMEKIDIG
jgi:hypothetical protein